MVEPIAPMQDYACAIGSAILSLNSAEADLVGLVEALSKDGELPHNFEGKFFSVKVRQLLALAQQQTDKRLRAQFANIIRRAYRLSRDRNNFAHALLWFDPFEGRHQRRFVRMQGPKGDRRLLIEHDSRSPKEIMEVAMQLDTLAADMAALATHIRNTP